MRSGGVEKNGQNQKKIASKTTMKKTDRTKGFVVIETDSRFFLRSLVGGGNEVPIFSTTDRTITHHKAADMLL